MNIMKQNSAQDFAEFQRSIAHKWIKPKTSEDINKKITQKRSTQFS